MRAVVFKSPYEVNVEQVEDPKIGSPRDALLRVTTSGICGSDLHMYEGRTGASPGIIFGHEIMGIIEEVGDGVVGLKPGDRVVLPFNVACGFCFNCVRGFTSACLTVNPHGVSGGYGYVDMGPYRGGQAEQVLVPFADFNCLKLPGSEEDELEDDFVLLSDIFPTGYHGAVLAGVFPGSTVAVFGAGPVGLMAAYSASLMGAGEIYVVDYLPERLDKARQIGAITIDFSKGDPVGRIMELRMKSGLKPGEEKMPGVLCGVDAVGYQARDTKNPGKENPSQVLEDLARLVNPTGSIGIVGVYFTKDPRGVDDPARKGNFLLPWGRFFEKGIAIGMGQTPVKKYNAILRDLIVDGRAKPSFVISHRIPLSKVPEAYRKFDERTEGHTKVVIKPKMH
ncbi:MAG: glutathione-independent formaldehyde dehydrogenase [Syntrophales bacterium]|nr:glutathione-independent formaldehyde dehydrogenase [Syntrophales bacterium]